MAPRVGPPTTTDIPVNHTPKNPVKEIGTGRDGRRIEETSSTRHIGSNDETPELSVKPAPLHERTPSKPKVRVSSPSKPDIKHPPVKNKKETPVKAEKQEAPPSDSGRKQPHHNKKYFWGGATLAMVGGGILGAALVCSPLAPLGCMMLTMGLIAYTWAYADTGDMPDQQPMQPPPDLKKDDKSKEEDSGENEETNINSTKGKGKLVAKPVEFSGGPYDFSGKDPFRQPPPLQEGYIGPGFAGIHGALAPVFGHDGANAAMNNLGNLFARGGEGFAANPAALANTKEYQQFKEADGKKLGTFVAKATEQGTKAEGQALEGGKLKAVPIQSEDYKNATGNDLNETIHDGVKSARERVAPNA